MVASEGVRGRRVRKEQSELEQVPDQRADRARPRSQVAHDSGPRLLLACGEEDPRGGDAAAVDAFGRHEQEAKRSDPSPKREKWGGR